MLEIRENTPQVDVLGEKRWSIEVKRYIGAPEYRVTAPNGHCIAAFTDVSELRKFADDLQSDLDGQNMLSIKMAETYKQIIAAIEAVEA